MQEITPYYQKHIIVCLNVREDPSKDSCGTKNSEEIHKRLKDYVKEHGLGRKVRVSKSMCQDLCAHGPIVSVYPDNVVYSKVTLEDVDVIIKKHIDTLINSRMVSGKDGRKN